MMTSFAGNPNGNVGGGLYYLCYDTVGNTLYVCTVAGSANGTPAPQAVWSVSVSGSAFLLL